MKKALTSKEYFKIGGFLFESAMDATGTCYIDAYNYFMDNSSKNKRLRIVHGLVDGQGALEGITYNHAWVEDGNKIIDMTLPPQYQKSLSKHIYYDIGHIETTFSYDRKEVLKKILKFKHYGPWEKKLQNNKY